MAIIRTQIKTILNTKNKQTNPKENRLQRERNRQYNRICLINITYNTMTELKQNIKMNA